MQLNWLNTEVDIVRFAPHERAPLYEHLPKIMYECIGVAMRTGRVGDFEVKAGRQCTMDVREDLSNFFLFIDHPDYSQEITRVELEVNFVKEAYSLVLSTPNRVQTIWVESPHQCAFRTSRKLLEDMLLCAQFGSAAAQAREKNVKALLNGIPIGIHLIGTAQTTS